MDPEYPSHLHEDHNDYPVAPEKMAITTDISIIVYSDLAHNIRVKFNNQSEKLVPNVMPEI